MIEQPDHLLTEFFDSATKAGLREWSSRLDHELLAVLHVTPVGSLSRWWFLHSGYLLWQDREDRWEEVRKASCPADDTPGYWAANAIFEKVPYEDFSLGYGRDAGVFTTGDVTALALAFDMDPSWFTEISLSFADDDGTFVAPWPVALELARQLAPTVSDEVFEASGMFPGTSRRFPGSKPSMPTCRKLKTFANYPANQSLRIAMEKRKVQGRRPRGITRRSLGPSFCG